MKKIPTLFLRDPETNYRTLTRVVHPECMWVTLGEGTATRKYDGQCVMIDNDGSWWKRREVKKGKPLPEVFMVAQEDEDTGKTTGWVPVSESDPTDKYLVEAFRRDGDGESGTYEAVGPKIQGNPEGFDEHRLISHAGAEIIVDAPREYDDLAEFLAEFHGEGIVWHHPDGRMSKIKRKDFM